MWGTRRWILLSAALVAAVVAYVGYRIITTGPDTGAPTITVLGEDSANLKALTALNARFERELGFNVDLQPAEFEVALQKSTGDFKSHTGAYDIVLQYNFSLASFTRNGYVVPLGTLKKLPHPGSSTNFESDLFPNTWKETGYYYEPPYRPGANIQAVGYPFAANTMLLVYNRKLFNDPLNKAEYARRYGEPLTVPTSWDQYERVAAFFTNPAKQTYGVAMQGATGGWLYYEWCNFLFGNGGKLMDKQYGWQSDLTTPLNLTTPVAIAATERFVRLKPYNVGDFFGTSATEQRQFMRGGNVAMALMWSDYLFDLVSRPDGTFSSDFGFAPIPGTVSMLAGGAYYVNADSKHKSEALRYILLVMQRDNQIELVSRGLASPLRSAYDDPKVQSIPYIHALKASLDRGVYMAEAGPDSDLISNEITKSLQQVWRGDVSVRQGLVDAQRAIESGRISLEGHN